MIVFFTAVHTFHSLLHSCISSVSELMYTIFAALYFLTLPPSLFLRLCLCVCVFVCVFVCVI